MSNHEKCIFVTGGAGFIGSELIRQLLASTSALVVNIDKLTYAGNLSTLGDVQSNDRYYFSQTDICDQAEIDLLFEKFKPDGIMHLAAESHVDRSIDTPKTFLETNIMGTYTLLEATRTYRDKWSSKSNKQFRFHHVSTDEVYGTLGKEGKFTDSSPYQPRSPYAASKASSDHIVRAWLETYGIPIIMSNCSNNYGPYQYPEKLIPVIIRKALKEESIPIYGTGENVRDWIYVGDHARALILIFQEGEIGKTYNVGGQNEASNLEVAKTICDILDTIRPRKNGAKYSDLISYVTDRPGHDFRYAIDSSRIEQELGWHPTETFISGLRKTIYWYLQNEKWVNDVLGTKYHGERLGLKLCR